MPFAPGGSADLVGRLLAQQMSESFGQPVVVENKGGASGMLGNDYVAKSAPDGYTLTVGTLGPFAVNQTLYEQVPYDNIRDFAPITLTGISSHILVAHPSVPVTNVNELIAAAKAKPGQLTFASSGTGNATHLTFELFKARAGIDIVHVPYKGGGPAMADLVGGQVMFSFASMASAVPFVKAGRLRAIAVGGGERSTLFPDVPTVAESGLPGFASEDWQGILAPAKTPTEIVGKLNAEIGRILLLPEVKAKLEAAGFTPKPSTPESFGQFIQAETAKWGKLLKGIGLKAR
ncbi:MAG TPA: tripartite tricarboxylate transporter substrate binding protein [Burkholderiales bacterium]|nr:tripartite tricarboxylate transporter substrate binding protein [Burkholderiales bacterium]